MGYSAYSYTILGMKFKKSDLEKETETRGCEHKIIIDDASFCPTCGKPVWIEKAVDVFEDDNFHGLDVIFNSYDSDDVVVGKIICKTDWNDKIVAALFVDIDILNSMKTEICKVLMPLALWDPHACKIYTVLYESY